MFGQLPDLHSLFSFFVVVECILADEFVQTTLHVEPDSDTSDVRVSCIGCSGFCESLLLIEESEYGPSNGWCVHTLSVSDVVAAVSSVEEQKSAFLQFVKKECASKQTSECILLSKHIPRSRFLTITTIEEARAENVPRQSVCTLTQTANSWSVHCSTVLCRRGKNKQIKNIGSVNDVCCHIRKLLSHSDATTTADISLDSDEEENGVN